MTFPNKFRKPDSTPKSLEGATELQLPKGFPKTALDDEKLEELPGGGPFTLGDAEKRGDIHY